MRCLDLRHVDLDTETRPVRNGNCTADELQGLLGQALPVMSGGRKRGTQPYHCRSDPSGSLSAMTGLQFCTLAFTRPHDEWGRFLPLSAPTERAGEHNARQVT